MEKEDGGYEGEGENKDDEWITEYKMGRSSVFDSVSRKRMLGINSRGVRGEVGELPWLKRSGRRRTFSIRVNHQCITSTSYSSFHQRQLNELNSVFVGSYYQLLVAYLVITQSDTVSVDNLDSMNDGKHTEFVHQEV